MKIIEIGILGVLLCAALFSCGCIDTNPLDTDYAVQYSCLTQSGTEYFETYGEASNFANQMNRYGTCNIRITEVGDVV
jgi:hypothetical protein